MDFTFTFNGLRCLYMTSNQLAVLVQREVKMFEMASRSRQRVLLLKDSGRMFQADGPATAIIMIT